MIAVTMGDANGVGPDILLRTFADGKLPEDTVVYGDRSTLEYTARQLGLRVSMHDVAREVSCTDSLCVHDLGLLKQSDLCPGTISPVVGEAAVRYLDAATMDALAGRVSAVVTLPIHKEASTHAFPGFQGHTERIADLCGVPHENVTMMLAGPDLIVTHVSTHVSLREATERVQRGRVLKVIRLTAEAATRLHRRAPRIAVAGLNPHAGENGKFGTEEIDHIRPAIEDAQTEGIDASGPHSADTIFRAALAGKYDSVVCMYHDQGHIPMKLHGFAEAVNVTLGLPIIRTSVDHGTAYDIAGQGIADTRNFVKALEMAQLLCGGTERIA